jgi:hypothetical protein
MKISWSWTPAAQNRSDEDDDEDDDGGYDESELVVMIMLKYLLQLREGGYGRVPNLKKEQTTG